ncbi:hypothetical protein Pint_05711 [Pistacia integerrima]|uniref:Uncharacterized protein n=1 Tax=Pistacia integerrima TaxID=434235 RepID=A0ACC0Z564_9ROSI|nr:hypothetical protein Pint_05711 [Pistacia integerrima]
MPSEVPKAHPSQLVVAGLIATVTFAAAFTMPGGYQSAEDQEQDQDQGTAILAKNSSFKAFVRTDAIAMVLSFAVLVHFFVSVDTSRYWHLNTYAHRATVLAMEAMVVAFITGTYVVLSPSLGLAIVTCLISWIELLRKSSVCLVEEAGEVAVADRVRSLISRK